MASKKEAASTSGDGCRIVFTLHPGGLARSWAVIILLAASALALGMAPLLLPDSYSWISNTTSEAAAQGLDGAFLARLSFLLFALGVGLLTFAAARTWGLWGRMLHALFAFSMAAAAVFSNRPIEEGVPVDAIEDVLHSVAATVMGFAFAVGVFVVAWRRHRRCGPIGVLDALAVTASIVLPLGMILWPALAGLLQRSIFLVAYVWYAREAMSERVPTRLEAMSATG